MEKREQLAAIERLLAIMDELREKCPWDRVQTMESLRTLTIEETYELAEAILSGSLENIKKELGDLLLHIIFYARIGSESGAFDIGDVAGQISEKLVFRHPHVFGDVVVKDENEVKENWEHLKVREGQQQILSGVPGSLPALIKAYRIQDKVRGIGFDWENNADVWSKVEEELSEVKQELAKGDEANLEEEIGDLLFTLVNAARLYGINPENALERSNRKFISRFAYLESKTRQQGRSLQEMSLEEMDRLWEEAKNLKQ